MNDDEDYKSKKYNILDGESEGKIHIVIRSRSSAINFVCDEPWAAIQVGDEDGDWPKLNKVQCVDVLKLAFPDRDFPKKGEEDWIFNASHADQILDFFQKIEPQVKKLMVHCYAGYSRSPAIGAALSKIHYDKDQRFFSNYCPNMLVYRLILNQSMERGKNV